MNDEMRQALLDEQANETAQRAGYKPAAPAASFNADYYRKRVDDFMEQLRKKARFWFHEEDDTEAVIEILAGVELTQGAFHKAINGKEERNSRGVDSIEENKDPVAQG